MLRQLRGTCRAIASISFSVWTGRWAGEWNLQRQTIHPGKTVLESRRGSTGDEINPWFAIERGNPQDEDSGNVWFGALGWSGFLARLRSSRMRSIKSVLPAVSIPLIFSYRLASGESLQTPTFYGLVTLNMALAAHLVCCIASN